MKDFTIMPHKLEDKIVLFSIGGINRLKDERGIDGHITGGMAVSSYLPIEEHRDTVDLDYCLIWGGGVGEYRELTSPLINELKNKGYSVRHKKSGFTHDLIVDCENDSLLIQHQRRSKTNFEKNRKGLEREASNHRTISKEGLSYAVLSPEDLILHKTSRILHFSSQYNIAFPREMSLKDFKLAIDAIRAEVLSKRDGVDPQEVARLRIFYDLYDIRCLGGNVGLNKTYFKEAVNDWVKNEFTEREIRRVLDRLGVSAD